MQRLLTHENAYNAVDPFDCLQWQLVHRGGGRCFMDKPFNAMS